MSSFRIAVLASGGGTNLQAILDQLHGTDGIEVVGVDLGQARGAGPGAGQRAGVETAVFPTPDYEDREQRDRAIGDWLEEREVDLVVLAGYMQLLSPEFVQRFPEPDHQRASRRCCPPSPGWRRSSRRSTTASKVTGVTVHFVDEGVDSGPIIFQRPVPVPPSRDWDELEEAIHATEHALLPEAIRLIAAGRVRVDAENPRLVHIDPR